MGEKHNNKPRTIPFLVYNICLKLIKFITFRLLIIPDMKKLTFILLLFLSAKLFSQALNPNVEFVGNKIFFNQGL